MATFTNIDLPTGQRIASAHQLGDCRGIVPISAGTVNSNYFLDTDRGRVFLRVYEQQEADGVAYEWELLEHLAQGGVAIPQRVKGPGPGELRVEGKPTAVFHAVRGEDLCQARVTPARAFAVGCALARASRVGESFSTIREGRFRLADVVELHARARDAKRAELETPLARLEALAAELSVRLPKDLPRGVVHGDLFRDNVLWDGDRLVALLDWESASDGVLIYDLAVALLAWCCGDTLDFKLAAEMTRGYVSERPLAKAEWLGLWWHMRMGCLRFATTRITDVYLRGTYPAGQKDFRRFLLRLDVVEHETPESLAHRLGAKL